MIAAPTIALLAFLLDAAVPPISPAVLVTGSATCPSPAEVARQLARLLPPEAPGPPDTAELRPEGGMLSITLRRGDGLVLAERRLAPSGPCLERARTVAIIVATWESDVHADFRVTRPDSDLSAPEVTPAPPAGAPTGPPVWDVGAALTGSLAQDRFAPGLEAQATLTPASLGRGVRIALVLEGERRAALGPGRAHWSRSGVRLGPLYRLSRRSWVLEWQVAMEAALFREHGSGFPAAYSDRTFDPGISTGVRVLGPGARVRPWFALDAAAWLRRRVLFELSSGYELELPRWTAVAAFGVSFGWRP